GSSCDWSRLRRRGRRRRSRFDPPHEARGARSVHPRSSMKLEAIELRRISLPLVAPFRTSFGVETGRDVLLIRAMTPEGDGWGECVALAEPVYSSEYVDGAQDVIRRHLAPRLFELSDVSAAGVGPAVASVKGHPMAKAAVESAVLDGELRAHGESFASHLGAVRAEVDCGVSVEIGRASC